MTLGTKLKKLRKEKGLSQAALEAMSGVNCKLLSKYENERIVPSADTLRKIAEALQISSDYLIFDNAPKDGISTLKDLELFEKFKEVENMSPENRSMIKHMIDALLIKSKVESVIKPKSQDEPWESRMQSTLDRLRSRNKDYSEEEILQIVNKAVKEVRSGKKTEH
ncbi:MAG: helix-turn-helix transcriptional regulator [Desulfobulbaceae bacterium]|nr:helix-turn-helix transcriptional regulator [Desulfobulbaceae bacterium]